MTGHTYVKLAAVATMIVAAVLSQHREAAPVLVTRVSESVVMKSEAVTPHEVIAISHRKVIVEHHEKSIAKPAKVERTLSPWTLPWSCSKVKWASSTFSKATLDAMRIAGGVAPLTAAEKQQARECIEGKRS